MNKTTKPITAEQLTQVIDHLDTQTRTITLLLMKATRIGDLLNNVNITDVYTVDGCIRPELIYNEGKTGKQRVIPLKGDRLLDGLRSLWDTDLSARPYETTTHLFYSRKATGRLKNTTLTNITVNRRLQSIAVGNWGIEEISTHAIRKTAARNMLDNGCPIEVISEMMNHSDVKTTRTYLQINNKDVIAAYEYLSI